MFNVVLYSGFETQSRSISEHQISLIYIKIQQNLENISQGFT